MQLTSLEILGFKSFADRTKLIFDDGITGIVGPNGCGKSNIVDSIKWVLGEQKTRNLRSEKMENIIFNGTNGRRKSNYAEVSLTFANTKNILPTEYSTVTITRKLYRSGESEYQINGVTCRLKDIHGLFMDTGISSDSYAIIELGMVDGILTNKDNERRKFFEEAAGISKYKIRKKQTLKRLQDTDDDLDRVEDLLFEIEKNLKSLEKQARRTQKYFELKEQYKSISSQYAFLTMRNIREKQKQIEILSNNLQDELVGSQSKMAQKEARVAELKKELIDKERALSDSQAELNKHIAKIQKVETDKSIKNERLKYLQQREIAVKNQMETERRQLTQNETNISSLRSQSEELLVALNKQQNIEGELKERLEGQKNEFDQQQEWTESISREHRELEQAYLARSRDVEIKKVQVESLEGEVSRAEEDKNRRTDDLDAFAEKSESLAKDVAELEKNYEKLKAKQEHHESELRKAEEMVNTLKDKVYRTNRLLDAKSNEHGLTKSLVENLEGFPESVKFLKKNAKWIQQAPLLSDVFACPETYKVALENYLDNYLSYYIVPSRKDALLAVRLLSDAAKGRANFFVLDELDSYKPQTPLLFTQATPAFDVVDVAPQYKKLAAFLLDKAYLVKAEQDIPEEVPDNIVFLTQAGNVSSRKYILSGGSLGLFEGKRLGRAKNLEKLNKEIASLQKQLTTEKHALEKENQKVAKLKVVDFNKEIEPVQRQLLERQRDLSVLQSREKEHREFMERTGQRTESLRTELVNLRTSIQENEPKIKEEAEKVRQLASQAEENRKLSQEKAIQLNSLTQQHNQEQIQLIQLRNQSENIQREINQKEEQVLRYQGNNERLKEELNQVIQDTEDLINSNLQDDEVIIGLYQQKKEKEERTGNFEQQVAMVKNHIREHEESMSGERRSKEELAERLNSLKEQGTEIKIQISSLKERMSVEFQIELNDLSEEDIFDKPSEEYDLEKVEELVYKLRNRIQGFGDINPMAVEAYNEMKERFDFITAQKADLIEAKNSLLETIAEIDQTAKEKFLETFTVVREHFMNVFRSLFSEDDKCDLILIDPENPLESEISIIARPKGKRPLTIKQLSGGEKTLTAVALLFAIYLIKPAPFCVFDEVDAPLDDANIDKFNNIIRDFSKESQFIIVTHNKRTMATTEVIYGVTMQNQGVSSVLPVSLETLNLN